MATSAFIDVDDLHKSYVDGEGNTLQILRGARITVERGETVSITGASGAGKSTFLHLLGALDKPDRGRIVVDGVDLAALNGDGGARFRSDTIGFVFQFHHLLNDFTALENVMMPMWIRSGHTTDFRKEGLELLAQVGIDERANHKPSQLSGGEQQRLAIARALANRPKVLLADEPTGNLDEQTGIRVAELLLKLNRDYDLTLILVTHNIALAGQMNRRYDLEKGVLHPTQTTVANA